MTFDPYQILNVSIDATEFQVRQAYRSAAKRCHPDAGGTHTAMIDVIAAWQILSDPSKRSLYDQQYARPQDPEVQAQWTSVAQEAQAAAEASAPQTQQDWAEFLNWLDTAVNELQGNPWGRFGSGAMAGAILGVCLGAFSGWLVGIGALAGGGVGFLLGGLGGGIATFKRPASL